MTTQQAAKKYQEAGFSPIPLVSGQKRPLLRDWTKYKEELITDYSLFTTDSLGLVCGYNNLEVLDIDAKHFEGEEFKEFIELLEDNAPDLLKKFIIQNTPSGGFHFLYRCKEIEGNQKLARSSTKEVTFETRGVGGQVAAWPTPGYSLENRVTDIQEITPEERSLLFSCARQLDRSPKQEVTYKAPKSVTTSSEGLTPWDDYNERTDAVGLLISYGWTFVKEDGKYVYLKRPGNSDAPDSGKIFKDSGCLWVWSTSTEFDPEKLYNPFAIYAQLEHGGDRSEAARTLYREGFGEQKKKKQNEVERYEAATSSESEEQTEDLLAKYILDPTEIIETPPTVLELRLGFDKYILGTAGNISLVQGKAKSRKSYFVSALAAACITEGFTEHCIKSGTVKGKVLYFDTEQGDFHSQKVNQRILDRAGIPYSSGQDYLLFFALRRADTNADRLAIVEHVLERFDDIALVIIDGIVDLSKGFNEEEESLSLVSRLMKLSVQRQTHIVTVLHENKNDQNARGHLGSFLVQKSETVYGVTRGEGGAATYIEGLYTRNLSFPDLELTVNGQEISIGAKEVEGPSGKVWGPEELERIAKSVVGKSMQQAQRFIRDVEVVTPKEAQKALSLMEAAKIITFTKSNRPKIALQDYTEPEEPRPF